MKYLDMINENAVGIRVPSSSANVGPGFDCFGMALSLYNSYEIHRSTSDKRIIIWEETKMVEDAENLVSNTINEILDEHHCNLGYLLIMKSQDIPVSRGLGSSSAATVAGIMAAFWLLKKDFSKGELLFRAAVAEGHPDNSTPAVIGGFCISKLMENRVLCHKIPFLSDVDILLMYPDFKLSTAISRSAMPDRYEIKDVVSNISNASLLISSLYQSDIRAFSAALEDRIHVPYRLHLIEGATDMMKFMTQRENCLGVTVSGAGSALISFFKKGIDMGILIESCENEFKNWKFLRLEVDERGAMYERCVGL